MTYSITKGPIMWHVSGSCPRCEQPLVLTHGRNCEAFLCCATYPRCKFVTGYDKLVHCLLDKIIELQDRLEDAGVAVARTLP